MEIKPWDKLNKNNLRITRIPESKGPYEEAKVKDIIPDKFPEMKNSDEEPRDEEI